MKTIDRTLVLGIGNTLLTDEGAGIHAMQLLRSLCADNPNLIFIDGGTLSFTLAAWIEDSENLLVFDAAELYSEPGCVKSYSGLAMDEFLGKSKRSAHEVGLLDLMDIARLTGHLPDKRALIGIQPQFMSWGMRPTAEVEAGLPLAVKQGYEILRDWYPQGMFSSFDEIDHLISTPVQTSDVIPRHNFEVIE